MINSVFLLWLFWICKCTQESLFPASPPPPHPPPPQFEHLISCHVHMRGLCIPDYLLKTFSQIFASSWQNEVILCNRIKGKYFGLYFQCKPMFINNKEYMLPRRKKKIKCVLLPFKQTFEKLRKIWKHTLIY